MQLHDHSQWLSDTGLVQVSQAHRPSLLFDAEKRNRLKRIVIFIASVYAPKFLSVHLKPRAFDGPENAIFLRDLLLFFNQQDQTLGCEAIKRCFLKHATAWLSPTNVAVSVFCDNLPFHFLPFSHRAIFSMAVPHSRNLVGAIYDQLTILQKSKMCSIVTHDFGGPSTITIVPANVSLVNCQLTWRGRKCATALVPPVKHKMTNG